MHVLHAHDVLGEAHAVDHQHRARIGVGLRRLLHLRARQAGDALELGPFMGAGRRGELLEAGGVFLDEVVVDDVLLVGGGDRGREGDLGGVGRIRRRTVAAGNRV